jgi:hypothetical protein
VWVESIERATEICNPHGPRWIDGNGMVLKPERFKFWGETPAGALAPIKWIWKDHQPPEPSVLPNHKSATLHATLLGQQLDDAERMGMVESYDPKKHGSRSAFACNVIPLGARVKPSGSIRMLVDPSLPGINEAMMELPCTLPTVEQIFKLVKPTSVLGKRDLQNGFFHVTLDPDARRYMGYTHPVTGQLYRWIVLPQGTKQSPAIFCAVSDAACRIFNKRFSREGISAIVVVYVDDYIIIADTHRDMRIAFAVMDEEAALLGMQWNPKKDMGRDSPLTSLEVLGIIIEAPTQMLKLPDEKKGPLSSGGANLPDGISRQGVGSGQGGREPYWQTPVCMSRMPLGVSVHPGIPGPSIPRPSPGDKLQSLPGSAHRGHLVRALFLG